MGAWRPERTILVKQIQALNRLECVHYTLGWVVDREQVPPSTLGPLLTKIFGEDWFKEKLLLVAHGEVVAGLDLSRLTEEDFKIVGDEVHLRLPPSEILSSYLDNDRTYTFDYSKGLLTGGNAAVLNDMARREAEHEMEKAAIKGGILERARSNCRDNLRALMLMAGYSAVTFEEVADEVPTPTPEVEATPE